MSSCRPWLWLAFGLFLTSRASADGAFADSQTLLLSRMQTDRIVASSDIPGLVVSEDAGASWRWICENAIGHFAALFQLGATPDETWFAITQAGLSRSDDAGCSWQHPDGAARRAGDVFPDPHDPQRVYMVAQIALGPEDSLLYDIVTESQDGGRTFGSPQYMTSTASITGVEVARSDPNSVYLTLTGFQLQHPYIVRSGDAGASWTDQDLSLQLGRRPLVPRILAVDPADANTLYVRVSDGRQDGLAISRDGGKTIQVVLPLEALMTAFLLRADGTLLVASADAKSFVSRDGGGSFATWTEAFHIQALAERDGQLYATANSRADGFAIARSADDGGHWQPLLRLDELRGPLACGSVPDECAASWSELQPVLAVLSGPVPSGDSGAGRVDPAAEGGGGEPTDDRHVAGGGCRIGALDGPGDWGWLLGCLAVGSRRTRFRRMEN